MGFSAGGEVAALVAYGPGDPDSAATDPSVTAVAPDGQAHAAQR